MTMSDVLTLFSTADAAAVALILAGWLGIGWRIEHPGPRPSVSILMAENRREWLRMAIERGNRIVDSQILGMLRANSSFFASSTLIAIGGTLALLGNSDQLRGVVSDLGVIDRSSEVFWEIKLILVLLFMVNAFLKFVWANRLFGYCGVLMGAIPNDPADPRAMPRAQKAAQINIFAARSFNRGLRSIYFAMAAAGWFLGPWGLLAATLTTCAILWRREFASQSRELLLTRDMDPAEAPSGPDSPA